MREKELALAIVQNALKYHSPDSPYPPSLVIDKEDYSDFDIQILKTELLQYDFTLIDGLDAPEPFSEMDIEFKKLKWYISKT